MYSYTFTLGTMKRSKKIPKKTVAARVLPATERRLRARAKREGYRSFSLWLCDRLDALASSEAA